MCHMLRAITNYAHAQQYGFVDVFNNNFFLILIIIIIIMILIEITTCGLVF